MLQSTSENRLRGDQHLTHSRRRCIRSHKCASLSATSVSQLLFSSYNHLLHVSAVRTLWTNIWIALHIMIHEGTFGYNIPFYLLLQLWIGGRVDTFFLLLILDHTNKTVARMILHSWMDSIHLCKQHPHLLLFSAHYHGCPPIRCLSLGVFW